MRSFYNSSFNCQFCESNETCMCDDGSKDIHLNFRASFDQPSVVADALAAAGLPKVLKHRLEARLRVVAAAYAAASRGRRVTYSRNRSRYTALKKYNGPGFSHRYVTDTIDELVAHGLLREQRAWPGAHLRDKPMQSRFTATPKLLAICAGEKLNFRDLELIQLKGDDGRLTNYEETVDTVAMRLELEEINKWLATIHIDLPAGLTYQGDYIVFEEKNGKGKSYVRPDVPRLVRNFCRNRFDCGGRLYSWWQNLPKKVRKDIRLNGEPVCELDFSALHPSLLYAQAGLRLEGDPYEIEGFTRKQGKLAFNTAVNAKNHQSAIGAIQFGLDLGRKGRTEAAKLYKAVKKKHSILDNIFGCDKGVQLQNVDSRIMMSSLLKMKECDMIGLPVHDSIVVPVKSSNQAISIMMDSYKDVIGCSNINITMS